MEAEAAICTTVCAEAVLEVAEEVLDVEDDTALLDEALDVAELDELELEEDEPAELALLVDDDALLVVELKLLDFELEDEAVAALDEALPGPPPPSPPPPPPQAAMVKPRARSRP